MSGTFVKVAEPVASSGVVAISVQESLTPRSRDTSRRAVPEGCPPVIVPENCGGWPDASPVKVKLEIARATKVGITVLA